MRALCASVVRPDRWAEGETELLFEAHDSGSDNEDTVQERHGYRSEHALQRPIVTVDDASSGPEWVTFLHQRADMAVSAEVVTAAEAPDARGSTGRSPCTGTSSAPCNSPLGETFHSATALDDIKGPRSHRAIDVRPGVTFYREHVHQLACTESVCRTLSEEPHGYDLCVVSSARGP